MVTAPMPAVNDLWDWLRTVPDPEIPVLSIVDLGIVRNVQRSPEGNTVTITVTPTYSGCPAMSVIRDEIHAIMKKHGIQHVHLETKLSPAWTTDWMTEDAKERLRAYGVAPPPAPLVRIGNSLPSTVPLVPLHSAAVPCPRCGSDDTELVSGYGSTACKAIYKCRTCLEPFDAFKRH